MRGKKYKKRTAKREIDEEEDCNEESSAPFALAGLYVLKVLLIDMTISLGDVGTDFWQVTKFELILKFLISFINV